MQGVATRFSGLSLNGNGNGIGSLGTQPSQQQPPTSASSFLAGLSGMPSLQDIALGGVPGPAPPPGLTTLGLPPPGHRPSPLPPLDGGGGSRMLAGGEAWPPAANGPGGHAVQSRWMGGPCKMLCVRAPVLHTIPHISKSPPCGSITHSSVHAVGAGNARPNLQPRRPLLFEYAALAQQAPPSPLLGCQAPYINPFRSLLAWVDRHHTKKLLRPEMSCHCFIAEVGEPTVESQTRCTTCTLFSGNV